ncbi:MAG: AmmeMemoRadiSam system protein B [Candidatus Bilamarchaeaceae archaeon]
MKIRFPAVAGSFYPEDPEEIKKMVFEFLEKVKPRRVDNLRTIICPHAGYIYSGPVAAYAYKLLENSKFKKIIAIGPSHYGMFLGAVEDDSDTWQTPLGIVKTGRISQFAKRGVISCYPEAHAPEHCLEVQLPFLQLTLKSDFVFYPLLTGEVSPAILADAIEPALDKESLLLISSDLSHYHPYADAVRIDRIANECIPALNFKKAELMEACGKTAIITAMHIAKAKGWKGVLLDYRNSGDTAGPKDGVVGYGAYAFYEG